MEGDLRPASLHLEGGMKLQYAVTGALLVAITAGCNSVKGGGGGPPGPTGTQGGNAPLISAVTGNGAGGLVQDGIIITGTNLSGATVALSSGGNTTGLTLDASSNATQILATFNGAPTVSATATLTVSTASGSATAAVQVLQGMPGPTGPAGVPGVTGAAGAAGANGVTGPAGANGVTGPAGAIGTNGVTGAQGPTGANGSPILSNTLNGTTITRTATGLFCGYSTSLSSGLLQDSQSGTYGYRAGKVICERTCNNPNAHVCSNGEFIASLELGINPPLPSGTVGANSCLAYLSGGGGTYGGSTGYQNDCHGFESANASDAFTALCGDTSGPALGVNRYYACYCGCNGNFPVACCK